MATGSNRDFVPIFGNTLLWKNLECPLCKQLFTNPKDLECGHTFCELCLKERIAKNASCKIISCPTCRKLTCPSLVSESTVDWVNGLRTNIALQKLVGYFQTEIEWPTSSDSEGSIISRYKDDRPSIMCFTHRRKQFKFFCEEHSLLMCDFCKQAHGRSCRSVVIEYHATPELVQACTFTQQRELAKMKSKLETALKDLSANRNQLKTQFDAYSTQLCDIEKDLQRLFAEINSKLKPDNFESITNQQQVQISEIQSLLAVIDFKNNELKGLSDYRDYSDKFIALAIHKDQNAYIESAVASVTDTLASVRMRHVGIDVMTSYLKLGGEYLGEVQCKPTKLERRKSV